MKCPSCGYVNRDNAHFCHRCGASLEASAYATTQPALRKLTKPIRRSPSSLPETGPLSATSLQFSPLPDGALLCDGRYIIVLLL